MTKTEPSEKVLLGVLDLAEAKRLRSVMESKGIALEIVVDPDKCSTGNCKVTVELHAAEKDVPVVAAFLKEERSRLFQDLNANPELHEQTFDTSQETATCPACGTTFPTTNAECPDCGLVFIADGQI